VSTLTPSAPAGPAVLAGRWRTLAALALAVLLAHGWLLDEVAGLGGADPTDPPRAAAMTVRSIVLPPPPPPAAEPPGVPAPAPAAPAPPPEPEAAAAQPPRALPAVAEAPLAAEPPPTPAPEPEPAPDSLAPVAPAQDPPPAPTPPLDPPMAAPAPIVDAASASVSAVAVVSSVNPAAASAGLPIGDMPTYPTRVPPSAELHYTVKRGPISANGTLRWAAVAGGYEMSLVGSLLGVTVLEQTSRGAFDAAGLAPERFTDRRSGRDQRAANFQRAAGKITFSATTNALPLVPGAQDRLSWMAQLTAIALADPGRLLPGGQVSMFVVGSRGEGDVWTFTVRSAQTDGLIELVREPRREFDNRVEVWLHPRRGFWPVRALQTSQGGDGSVELTLVDGPFPLSAR
jgi:Protein of unknown function (DUF3108)